MSCVNGTRIQIRAHRISRAELQGKHTQNAASASHVKDPCLICHIFPDLPDAQLGGLMHSRSERRARIDMDDHLILIFRFDIFPGRDDQNVVHIELMKILFPVIHPVNIFCLRFFDRALSYIHIRGHFLQFFSYVGKDRLLVLIFLKIKTEICHSVVRPDLGQNIYKHLLLVRLSERDTVLDLHSLYSQIHQHAADDILRFCRRFQTESVPFHSVPASCSFLFS